GTVAGAANEHIAFHIARSRRTISSDDEGNAVVDLQISRLKRRIAEAASLAVLGDECFFERFGKVDAPADSPGGDVVEVAKAVLRHALAILFADDGFDERNTLIRDIFDGAGRMVAAVLLLEIVGGDGAVLDDMFDDDPGALA